MSNWKKVTIGDIATFYNGKAHENCINEAGDYVLVNSRFVSTAGKTVKHSLEQRFPLIKGDIAMVMSDVPNGKALARCYLVKEDHKFTLNQRICCFRAQKAAPEFLYYALNRNKFYLSFDSGVTQTNLRKDEVLECPIYLPPIEEQKAIATAIQTWDTAIEKTEALIDAKERQFGWLKSKLLLRNPNAKHWKTETLGHYIEEKKDKSTVPDLHPCLTSSRRGMFLQDEYFSKQVASKDNTGYKIMSRGDFTYRSMSDDGTFVFNKQDIVDKGLISPAYGVFAPNKHMDADFLYYFLNSSAFKRALAGEVQGGTRTALKLNALKKLDVDIPELPEQKAIANKLNTAKHEIDLLIKLADQYRTQKRGLMQKLLSGEWHIKNKEAA